MTADEISSPAGGGPGHAVRRQSVQISYGRPSRRRIAAAAFALSVTVFATPAAGGRAGQISGREARCLALIAYTEAAVDGLDGMAAVIRVVRNRAADPRFPDDVCAVIAQVAQFQPVTQSRVLQTVVRDPEGYSIPQVLKLRSPGARRLLARAHALARAPLAERDPTGGALYFVNPDLMDRDRCPWFATLKRTARIGSHVFMTEYNAGEPPGPPALDCRDGAQPSDISEAAGASARR
jgi:spore germination cell wall hydrolase CwlJ-like protein